MTTYPCGCWGGCSCSMRSPANVWGELPASPRAANDDDAAGLAPSIAHEAFLCGSVDVSLPPMSDDADAEPVFSFEAAVFADGSIRSVSSPHADFLTSLRAMLALRDSIDADLRAGPALCPFAPRNRRTAS